jgi:phospholipid/cholesterol/gamma-HCH transport system substrate-binding protein
VSLGAAANVSDADSKSVESVPEGGTLAISRTEEATQIDEIFTALDEQTRTAFQRWQQNAAVAVEGRGLDLNDAFGNLGPFLTDASDVVDILRRQKDALKGLVRDTGTVFEALTERDQQLAGLIVGSDNTFDALADQDRALAETFQIFPTFQRETRLTLERLDQFQANTRPLVEDLIPVARDLSPTLHSIRQLSPNLRSLFVSLGRLERASKRGLPALRDVLNGLGPLFDQLDPFLANLNPVIRYLNFQRGSVVDFLVSPGVALSGRFQGAKSDPAPRHGLRQLPYTSSEALAIYPNRVPTNRGNAYLPPNALASYTSAKNGIFPNFDCKNTDYTPTGTDTDEDQILPGQSVEGVNNGNPPDAAFAPCFATTFPNPKDGNFGDGRAPQLFADP